MSNYLNNLKSFLLAFLFAFSFMSVRSDPEYKSTEAKELIQKMVEAHGGYDKWEEAESISFDLTMYLPSIPKQKGMSDWDIWRVEYTTVDLKSGKGYMYMPLENSEIISDGEKTWSINSKGGNPKKWRMAHHSSHINLPWLSQMPYMIYGKPGKAVLPIDNKEYYTVRLTYKSEAGHAPEKYQILYIDKETYLLKATKYIVTYAFMLDMMKMPKEVKSMPPFLRVNDNFENINGMVVPLTYQTYDAKGENLYGMHLVTNFKLNDSFPDEKIEMRSDAVIDESYAVGRKMQ